MKATLWRASRVKLAAFAVVAAWLIASQVGASMTPPSWGDDLMDTRPDARGSAAWLIAEHDCWTSEAPEGASPPRHSVVTRSEARGPEYVGPRLTARALDQTFGDGSTTWTIHGYCK